MVKQIRQVRVPKAATTPGSEDAPAFSFIPADPADPRLQLGGAVVLEDGKLNTFAYEDLKDSWKGEPPPEQHPNPATPGVRSGEIVPKGLRVWDDVAAGAQGKDGAGWIAVYSSKANGRPTKKEKWFNIRSCGSWRLAFLLAKLQRSLWERGVMGPPMATAGAPEQAPAAAAAEPATPVADSGPADPSTPKGKRRAPPAEGQGTSRKQPKKQQQEAPTEEPAAAAAKPSAGPSKLDAFKERMLAKLKKEAGEQASG